MEYTDPQKYNRLANTEAQCRTRLEQLIVLRDVFRSCRRTRTAQMSAPLPEAIKIDTMGVGPLHQRAYAHDRIEDPKERAISTKELGVAN